MNESEWLRNEVGNGLQALLALRLKNAPAEDMVELTADIWLVAFSRRLGVVSEEIDAPRIAEGFRRYFPTAREWPAPIDVLGLIPRRPPQKSLPAPKPADGDRQRVKKMVDDLIEQWRCP